MCTRLAALFLLIHFACATDPPVPSYLAAGKPTNEGVRLRITKPGLDHITNTAGHIADALVPSVKVADTKRDLEGAVKGTIAVKNIKIIKFTPPEKYGLDLISPKQLKVTAKNMGFEATFDYYLEIQIGKSLGAIGSLFGGVIPPFTSSGIGVAKGTGENIYPTLSLNRNAQNGIELKLDSCTGDFTQLDVAFRDDKLTGDNKLATEKSTQKIIIDAVCHEIGKVVKEKVNTNLESLATVKALKLDDLGNNKTTKKPNGSTPKPNGKPTTKPTETDDNAEEEKLIKNIMKKVKTDVSNLFLDYRLIRDPVVFPTYAETAHKGEISWKKLGKTPFYPYDMLPIDSSANRMLYLQISEYTLNSLVYHAYQNKILSLTADEKETPFLASSLTTTCTNKNDLLCFGNGFESVAKKYPNHKIQLKTYPTQPPYINVTAGKGLLQQIYGKMEVYAKPPGAKPQFNLFKSDYSMSVAVAPKVLGEKLYGNLSVDNVNVKVTESPLSQKDQEDFSNQAEFAISLIAEKLDAQLRKGMTIPQIGYATLVKPNTVITDRTILVDSDFKLDEEKLKSEAKAQLNG